MLLDRTRSVVESPRHTPPFPLRQLGYSPIPPWPWVQDRWWQKIDEWTGPDSFTQTLSLKTWRGKVQFWQRKSSTFITDLIVVIDLEVGVGEFADANVTTACPHSCGEMLALASFLHLTWHMLSRSRSLSLWRIHAKRLDIITRGRSCCLLENRNLQQTPAWGRIHVASYFLWRSNHCPWLTALTRGNDDEWWIFAIIIRPLSQSY